MNVYISGPLTGQKNIDELRKFYEAIACLCNSLGFDTYVPHLATDPWVHQDTSPEEVFQTDKTEVSKADLVVAYVGVPSLGVGMELAYAEIRSVPIILLSEKEAVISRFCRGIPTVIDEVKFLTHSDALTALEESLEYFLASVSLLTENLQIHA